MSRRRKNEGLADVLVMLPWWVSIVLGGIAFGVMRWIVPSIFASNPNLVGLGLLSRSLAWLALVLFGVIGAIAFARSKTIVRNNHSFGHARSEPRSTVKPSVNSSHINPAHSWGASNQTVPENAKSDNAFHTWTLEALRVLEWKRFELLCAKYYEIVGFKSETIKCGADGGIDVKLFKLDPNQPLAIVQCKAWNVYSVGVKEVRELLGVMAHEKVMRGIFITTGTYTKDALSFGVSNPIQLLDGAGFLMKIKELSEDRQHALLQYAFEGDYKTPTCASCGIKMTKRDSKRGPFWGCLNYPRCKSTFAIKY
jgi:restriction system protein